MVIIASSKLKTAMRESAQKLMGAANTKKATRIGVKVARASRTGCSAPCDACAKTAALKAAATLHLEGEGGRDSTLF